MKSIMKRVYYKIVETRWKYKFNKSTVRICRGGQIEADDSVEIINSFIYVDTSSKLILKRNVRIEGVVLFLTKGAVVEINEDSFLEVGRNPIRPEYIIDSGTLMVGHHSKLACQRLWVRYSGTCTIGNYTNINSGSEIRSDDRVAIGNFCQISYNTRIWDTNTHCIYPAAIRNQMTIDYFPSFGKEFERPVTKPIRIGDSCWFGEFVAILKGCQIGDEVIVGFNTTLSNATIPSHCSVVQDINLSVKFLKHTSNE